MTKHKQANILGAVTAIAKAAPPIMIALAVIVVIIFVTGSFALIGNFLSPPPPQAQVDLSDTIISSLSARSQLLTAEETIRDLPILVRVRAGIGNMLGYRATYETDIVIKVGFNFVRDEFEVAKTGENIYEIQLPKAELLSCSMSPVQETDRSMSMTADWENAKQLAEYMLMQQAVREAIDNEDLFLTAQANARETINDLIHAIDAEVILNYVFLASETTHIDDTCQIRQPLLWEYNAEEQSWRKQ